MVHASPAPPVPPKPYEVCSKLSKLCTLDSATCSPATPTRSGSRVCLLPDAQTSPTAGQWLPTVAIMRHCQKGLRRKPVLRTLLLLFVASVAASLWLSLQAVRAKNGVAVGRQRHISSTPSPLAQSGVAKRELWPQYPTLELREDAYYVHDPRWMVLPAEVHVPSAEAVAAACAGRSQGFVCMTMYDDDFVGKAERLLRSCHRFGVCCVATRVARGAFDIKPLHDAHHSGDASASGAARLYRRLVASKALFLKNAHAASPLPVLWVDADFEYIRADSKHGVACLVLACLVLAREGTRLRRPPEHRLWNRPLLRRWLCAALADSCALHSCSTLPTLRGMVSDRESEV
jgi:hypothetical protein